MPGKIAFAREPLTGALLAEAEPLLRAHWAEIAHYPDIPLAVDVESYVAAEAAGLVRCFTARESTTWRGNPIRVITICGDYATVLFEGYEGSNTIPASAIERGALLGYAVYFVRSNLHYRDSLQATQDVLYLAPSVRGGTGYKFIAWCDAQLAVEGVQAVYHHVKERHNFGRLLERQGYELVDLIYAKRLDVTPVERAMRETENDALGRALAEALS